MTLDEILKHVEKVQYMAGKELLKDLVGEDLTEAADIPIGEDPFSPSQMYIDAFMDNVLQIIEKRDAALKKYFCSWLLVVVSTLGLVTVFVAWCL